MAVSIIDGRLEEVVLRRRRKLASIYDRLTFRLADGGTKTWAKAIVSNDVADHLKPGQSGRFYLYTAIDHRGVHGVRTADGADVYGFGKQNEIIALVITAVTTITNILSVTVLGHIQILASILMVLGLPMYFAYRHTRVQAERQYQADAGFRPPAA